jgi:hypothetical protein
MRKPGYAIPTTAAILLLLALILFLAPGIEVFDSETTFMTGLHNSLYHLGRAKQQWVEEKHRSEGDVPTMTDLRPYLGKWANHIERLIARGVRYEITPISEMNFQSDIAIFNRDLRFRRGYCRFYPAGTRYCLQTGWVHPVSRAASFRSFYIHNRERLVAALFLLGMGTLMVFAIRKLWWVSDENPAIVRKEIRDGIDARD